MSISSKFRTLFRGNVSARDLFREVIRRKNVARRRAFEKRSLETIAKQKTRLAAGFSSFSLDELSAHFSARSEPFFWPGDVSPETRDLTALADRIVGDSVWELAGFGPLEFNAENVWRRDPISGKDWGTLYHADVLVYKNDGSDIRVLWELNRFGHAITLALAFTVTKDEKYAETLFLHVESWVEQNPYGRGANWNCAMEAALRAINLLAAFDIFRRSNGCTPERLAATLQLFDQHGRFIVDNIEFSHLVTSNHYLSDVVGLFWIGTMLPELEHAEYWREFGLREMLREMDKQILPDGTDFEASTCYHKFVTEMLLYSFILAERNGIKIEQRKLEILRRMLQYLRKILRSEGRMPLIGDADGSQIVPIVKRDADDAAYLLSVGAVFLNDQDLKLADIAPEVLWLCGESGVQKFRDLADENALSSTAFPDAGSYVMRDGDLFLHFNANDCGIDGRGSHGHNDALSIEISAFGREFIIDPGSYVYNLDRDARQLFRSTAYHSTVMIDSSEQNTCEADLPFVMGNEARPKVLSWESAAERDRVSAEHYGYMRFSDPILHRRSIEFDKAERYWLIEDIFEGNGKHEFSFSFHIAPGLTAAEIDEATVRIADEIGGSLLIAAKGIEGAPEMIAASRSVNYGHKDETQILRWNVADRAPLNAFFLLIPVAADEKLETRLALSRRLTQNIGS